jgi:hypothetical protein
MTTVPEAIDLIEEIGEEIRKMEDAIQKRHLANAARNYRAVGNAGGSIIDLMGGSTND